MENVNSPVAEIMSAEGDMTPPKCERCEECASMLQSPPMPLDEICPGIGPIGYLDSATRARWDGVTIEYHVSGQGWRVVRPCPEEAAVLDRIFQRADAKGGAA